MPFDVIAYVLVGYPAEVVNTKEQMLYHYGDEEAASAAELIPTLYTPKHGRPSNPGRRSQP